MLRRVDALDVDLILDFYDRNARDLPWRRPDSTPWAVLVSEVMLQQTPVTRVLPVYEQWLRRWPAPPDLAAEPAGEAIRAWGRLGYPRRALRLHAAAGVITAEHGGTVPATVEELLKLPGIGDYTARAVAAFAFGARVPVVDTNVRRVLSRAVRGVDEPRASATAADRLEMSEYLPDDPATAARFSVAVMELGALACTATRPDCERCPLSGRCRWLSSGAIRGAATRPAQAWHGTDRQVRGLMIAMFRNAGAVVAEERLVRLSDDPDQGVRCLRSLLADGLAVEVADRVYALPR